MSKFTTFAITLRPLQGVTDNDVDFFTKWCVKHTKHHYIVTEKLDHERHLHAAVFLKNPVTHSNLCTTLVRLYKHLDTEEKKVFRSGIKIMYNIDWIKNYLSKGDDTVIISKELPEAHYLEQYFPEALPAKKGPSSCNPYYANLQKLWYEYQPTYQEINTITARDFLFKLMYKEDRIKILRDDKTISQTARHLVRYLLNKETCTFEPPPFEPEEGKGYDHALNIN